MEWRCVSNCGTGGGVGFVEAGEVIYTRDDDIQGVV